MMKKLAIAICASLMIANVGATEVSQADIEHQNSISDASTKDITPKTLDDFFDEFSEQYGVMFGEENKGRTFFTGRATVAVPSTDPDFAKALNLAFDTAMLNMQSEFIRDAFGRQTTEIQQKIFSDDSTNAREFEKLPPEGRLSQIFGKVVDLTGAKLDEALRELGVDVEPGFTDERKKVLFADSMVQKMSETAFGNMQGLVPVQTSLTQDGSGQYQVGVIAVMSDKTRQVANDMRQKRASLVTGKGRALSEFLPESNADYINEHGIRLVYNENGAPVILSYGQWSYLPDSDSYMNSRKQEMATEQAVSRADAAVAAFVNTALQFKRSSENSVEIEKSITEVVQNGDTSLSEKMAKNIIDITSKDVTARTDMNLRGLRTLKRWSAKDANGVNYVGVVRFYTHDNVQNTERIVAPIKPAKQEAKQQSNKPSQDVSRKSRVVNDMDDF